MSISADSPSDENLNRGPLALLLRRQYEFPFGINKVQFSIFSIYLCSSFFCQQAVISPLVHYFVNKTLETDAEALCSSLMSTVKNLAACSSLTDGSVSFFRMQCLQQV